MTCSHKIELFQIHILKTEYTVKERKVSVLNRYFCESVPLKRTLVELRWKTEKIYNENDSFWNVYFYELIMAFKTYNYEFYEHIFFLVCRMIRSYDFKPIWQIKTIFTSFLLRCEKAVSDHANLIEDWFFISY